MGMGIQGTSSTSATQSAGASAWQQNQQNYQALNAALKSGDLSAAKDAYSQLTQNKNIDSNSPLGKIGQALQSGDIQSAQQLQQSMRSGHHHHHSNESTTATTNSSNQTSPVSATIGNNVNVTA